MCLTLNILFFSTFLLRYKKKESKEKDACKNKENLDKYLKQTQNPHWKHLVIHYKCGICFKYMIGKCKEEQCKYKHPPRCSNYNHKNGFNCEYKDKCIFAHIRNTNENDNETNENEWIDDETSEKDKNENQTSDDETDDTANFESNDSETNNNEMYQNEMKCI